MARIAIIAPGSRGDVQPYIALGWGLKRAGNQVRFLTHANFEGLVKSNGLDFYSDGNDARAAAASPEMLARVESGNFPRLMAQMAREAEKSALTFAEVGLDACKKADLILGGMGGIFTGISLAEKLKIPFLQAYLVPFTPTRAFATVLMANPPKWLGGWLNRLSHHAMRQMMWQGFHSADTLARQGALQMRPAPFFGPYRSKSTRSLPILYGFSPAVVPAPADWGANTHVTGYWFLESPEHYTPPPALAEFLAAGPAPVYVGFGSMSSTNPRQTTALVLKALEITGQRAVLLSGWGAMQPEGLPGTVCMVDSVPHDWLFERVSAVVHHGGVGTAAAGFRAGVPSVITPYFGDQPFWGRRAHDLGVGPVPIPRAKLTPDSLARAIDAAVTDGAMRARARLLGEKIRAEDGVRRAVEVIGQVLKGKN